MPITIILIVILIIFLVWPRHTQTVVKERKYLEFPFFCSICAAIAATEAKEQQEKARESPIPPKALKGSYQWHLYKIDKSEMRNSLLSKYLQSANNRYITPVQSNKLLAEQTLYFCKHQHVEQIFEEKHLVKNWYCTNCGEEYAAKERETFEYSLVTGLDYTNCKRCKKFVVMSSTISIIIPGESIHYCLDCGKKTIYDSKDFGQAHPLYVVKKCTGCGSEHLQGIETARIEWMKKELIGL